MSPNEGRPFADIFACWEVAPSEKLPLWVLSDGDGDDLTSTKEMRRWNNRYTKSLVATSNEWGMIVLKIGVTYSLSKSTLRNLYRKLAIPKYITQKAEGRNIPTLVIKQGTLRSLLAGRYFGLILAFLLSALFVGQRCKVGRALGMLRLLPDRTKIFQCTHSIVYVGWKVARQRWWHFFT